MSFDIDEYIGEKRALIDRALEKVIPAREGLSRPKIAARYALLAQGSRWRPLLSLTLADEYENQYLNMVELSCAAECMQAASITTDDLPSLDDGDLRRGRLTVHKECGTDIAQLAIIKVVNCSWMAVQKYGPEKYKSELFAKADNVVVNLAGFISILFTS